MAAGWPSFEPSSWSCFDRERLRAAKRWNQTLLKAETAVVEALLDSTADGGAQYSQTGGGKDES